MGNEALRSSRHSTASSPIRRRQSKGASSSGGGGGGGGQNYTPEDEIDRNNQEFAQTPKPVKRMDKIRRSLSFRRKKKSDKRSKLQQQQSADVQTTSLTANLTTSASAPLASSSSSTTNNNTSNTNTNNTSSNATTNTTTTNNHNHNNNANNANSSSSSSSNSTSTNVHSSNLKSNSTTNQTESTNSSGIKPPLWLDDEKRVRAGNCSFQVKYLGSVEVSDSRGMHLCEMAIEKLLAEKEKKKPIKAILYVSGDSLRVVDESNKTLLVDQTIEKVSFCAPDRHHENGFAYICRDGTTRRWLCHCFMAIKDTLKGSAGTGSSGGERLSHAVGCAFSVCLERKQKRERENVSMEVGPNHSFTRLGSFRQASLTERLEDPQIVMPAAEPVPIKQVDNPHAIERPKPNPEAFNRQNSLRGTGGLQLPFKRNVASYKSLKPGELPSFQQQKLASGLTSTNNNNNNINNTTPITKTSLLLQQHQQQKLNNSPPATNSPVASNSSNISSSSAAAKSPNQNISDGSNRINTINELPEEQFTNQNEINNSTKLLHNENGSNHLSERLNNQLKIGSTNSNEYQTTSNSTNLTTNAQQQLDWSSLNKQSQQQQQQQQQIGSYYQMSSSVFATPQSTPVTPSPVVNGTTTTTAATASPSPPPLPPMPAQYITATPMLFQATQSNHLTTQTPQHQHLQHQQHLQQQQQQQQAIYYQQQYQTYSSTGTPLIQMVPVHMPLQQQLAMMAIPSAQLQSASAVYTTPLGGPGSLMAATPVSTLSSASLTSTTNSNALNTTNTNETFEQKWARIQAAKKTNPFAEDIAKKFEIKL